MWDEEKKVIIDLFDRGFSLDEIQEYMFRKFPDFSCTIKILEEIIQDYKIEISEEKNAENKSQFHEVPNIQPIKNEKNNLLTKKDTKPIKTTKKEILEQLAVKHGLIKASDISNP